LIPALITETAVPAINTLQSMHIEYTCLIIEGLSEYHHLAFLYICDAFLDFLVKEKAVNMNYINYNVAIVEKHKVELVGWPATIPFANPSMIGTVGDI
jgi:hypothetical protein